MELQFHPASGRSTVRTVVLGPRGERALIVLAAAGAGLAVSLWWTAPALALRRAREDARERVRTESRQRLAETQQLARRVGALKARAVDFGDRLNRIAFLYGIATAVWPRILDPQTAWLSPADPERLADRLAIYGRALEKGRRLLAEREASDPALAGRVPALFPLAGQIFEPSVRFGPRVSPWTGREEFFPGVDIAAPAGTEVVAPGAGTVVFAGAARRSPGGWLWRLGNLVVLSHGEAGATVFGHLARIEVRRGARVARGAALGNVGSTGWTLSPQLHYEFWRSEGASLRPTDPLAAAVDRRLGRVGLSLAQMEASSAPGPLESLPGISGPAEPAVSPERSSRGRAAGPRRRRRI